jgi:DNA-binding CsgD family transcriptional regulator
MQDDSFQAPVFYDDYVAIWQDSNKKINDEAINQKYAELSRLMGEYASLNNQFISIFNTKSQRVLYMSENYLDVMGYTCTEEQYKKWSTVYWLRDLPMTQGWFFMQMTMFFKNVVQPKLKEAGDKKSLNWYMHNFLLHPPKSHKHHISLLGSGLEFTPDGSMVVMMLIIKDVGGLVKDNDTWWSEFRINGTDTYAFNHLDKKFTEGSILSDREKEVLRLVEQGKESKEIADILFLSSHTVDKHKKNMLERTGAKDTSSLINICKSGKII